MRAAALASGLAVPILAAGAPAVPAADPTVQVDFSNPGLSPAQWSLTLRPDGSGHFRSPAGRAIDHDTPGDGWPAVDREIQVCPPFAGRVFAVAKRHSWFNAPCESHLKVAFQGWMTLAYSGPQGRGSCTFNYSKDKEIEDLGASLDAVAQTLLEGARLQLLLEHGRLGLDAEMEFLAQAAEDGRAQQIGAIHEILERLAQDDAVLERVRRRARRLLAQGSL